MLSTSQFGYARIHHIIRQWKEKQKHFPHSKRLHSLSFDNFPLNINHMTIKHFRSLFMAFLWVTVCFWPLEKEHWTKLIPCSLETFTKEKETQQKLQFVQFVGMYNNSQSSKTGLAKLSSTSFRHVSQQ